MKINLPDRIKKTIADNSLLESGDSVLVGVSGGPDSVCLLHALSSLACDLGITLHAFHLNHMLRKDESNRDENYVHDFCIKLGIPLHVKHADILEASKRMGLSIEEAGREVRYEFLTEISNEINAGKIAVAHNSNDQAETLIMRLIRGTGLDGLKGMDYKRGKIIRPLLDIPRKDIEEYCGEFSLNPVTDSSNLSDVYMRNRIRLGLIPYINSAFSTNITETMCRLSSILKEDSNYIEENANIIYNHNIERNNNERKLRIKVFEDCHAAIAGRLVRIAVKELKGDLKGIESLHVENVLRLARIGRTGAIAELPGYIKAIRSYEHIVICKKRDDLSGHAFDEALNIPGITRPEGLDFTIVSEIKAFDSNGMDSIKNADFSSLVQFFDYEKLSCGINIRNRKDGDRFKPFGSNGTKKLKEYLIDNKIPRQLRDEIPLIASGNEIVWIIGYKTSDKFRVTENTKRVLVLTYTKCI